MGAEAAAGFVSAAGGGAGGVSTPSWGGASQVALDGATAGLSADLAFLLSDGLGAVFFLAEAALAFLASAGVGFLAAAETGLRIRTIAGAKQMATDRRTGRVCVDVIWALSNAKALPGSRGSAGDAYFTVKVSERGKVAELGPTMTFTGPDSTAHPLVS